MAIRSRPGQGLSVSFESQVPRPSEAPINLLGLHFTVDAQIRGQVEIDFRDTRPRSIALGLASACLALSTFPGPWRSAHTIKSNVRYLKRFCAFLDERRFSGGINDLSVSDIDAFDAQLPTSDASAAPRHGLAAVIVALRELRGHSSFAVSPELDERLRFISTARRSHVVQPRDAYSDYVADQLRRASAQDIVRLDRESRQLQITPQGVKEENLVNSIRGAIRERGVVRCDDPTYKEIFWALYRRSADTNSLLDRFHREAFLFSEEIIPYLVYISLQSGLEIECCKWLRADCLETVQPGLARLRYWKGRARGSEHKSLIVRDAGLKSVGGAIRSLLRLTEHARVHSESEFAICYFNQGRLREGYRQAASSVASWIARHDIRDDDGAPLKLQLSRLRKTHKSTKYRTAAGELAVFVQGHSRDVAVNNYAQIPAHRALHEQTVAEALRDALRPFSAEVHIVDQAAAPEEVSWLAGCTGFTTGSHSAPGRSCEHPFWGCLNCTNARYSVAHLPAIVAFAAFMRGRRKDMSADEWDAAFGAAHFRISHQILPKFSDAAIAEAKEQARTLDLYLPAEALQ